MNDYKELIEMLRSRSKAIIHEDAKLVDIPEENIWDADANALVDAANAIEQLVKERDAAVADLKEYASCDYCKHSNSECDEYWAIGEMGLSGLCNGEHFEWRGVQGVEHEAD